MGIPAPLGVAGGLPLPAGDRGNIVLAGKLTAVGSSPPVHVIGPMNVAIWGSVNTSLTTTNGSSSASVVSGTGIAAGATVNSVNVPRGTTWATFSGTSGTLALPTITLYGFYNTQTAQITGLPSTAGLVGATVIAPGIPGGTTVSSIVQTAIAPTSNMPQGSPGQTGIIALSATPTAASGVLSAPVPIQFVLTNNAVTTGVDAAALFTGPAVPFSATVYVEKSYDGGQTFLTANTTPSNLATTAGTAPWLWSFGEPELGVLYRVNCTAYTSGTINYRISTTGAAAMSLAINQLS